MSLLKATRCRYDMIMFATAITTSRARTSAAMANIWRRIYSDLARAHLGELNLCANTVPGNAPCRGSDGLDAQEPRARVQVAQ